MKRIVWLLLAGLVLAGMTAPARAASPTTKDLLGKWEGVVNVGKFKFTLILRIANTENGRIGVTMDIPDQGQKGLPVNAILFNSPDVRIEIDQFQTAYNGKLTEDLSEIQGEFEEGPGGRPMAVNFTRSTKPDEKEPERTFTFQPGETRDIRGHWKTSLEAMPGMSFTFAVNIGRLADGTFKATLDVLEQGARDIPATSVKASGDQVEINWEPMQMSFNGKLDADANRMSGEWKMRGKPSQSTLERLDKPASLLPKEISYEPNPNNPDDIRGTWAGRLDLPGQKLRLILKVGQTPDGNFGGTLISPDQGPGELPMSSGSYSAPKVTLEWKGIRGKFEGTLTNNGSVLDGTWEQFGNKMPLKLERSAAQKPGSDTATNK